MEVNENSTATRKIVSAGIIPAIEQTINEEETVDQTVAEIGLLVEFYNKVIWFGNAYKVLMEGETEIQDDLDLFFCEHSEVIGNIHDTPKL